MIKKWILFVSIAMLTVSCDSIFTSKPAGTLNEDEMINILVDIHLTEATLRISNDSLSRKNDSIDQRIRFAHVFRKHDIDPDNFNKSMDYYLEHIELLDKIYIEVINRLSEMEVTLQPKVTSLVVNKKLNMSEIKPSMDQLKNPWFLTLYKPSEPAQVQYLNPDKYPVTQSK
jgi:hypothetical protein